MSIRSTATASQSYPSPLSGKSPTRRGAIESTSYLIPMASNVAVSRSLSVMGGGCHGRVGGINSQGGHMRRKLANPDQYTFGSFPASRSAKQQIFSLSLMLLLLGFKSLR